MFRTYHWLLVSGAVAAGLLGVGISAREAHAAGCISKSNTTKIYAHLMPWFEDPSTSGNGTWGLHWTMANENPNVVDGSGRRQIASYYYPLIGPYGSSDPDVIEYQLLQMKYSGIDGALIDWPGTIQAWDYPKNRQNAEAFMGQTSKMGLGFGVVYEDNDVGAAYAAKIISDEIGAAKNDMSYVRDNYFTKSNYISVDGAPLLLVFGPQTFLAPSDWTSIFSVFSSHPTFLTEWYFSDRAGANAQGEFAWIYSDFMTGLQNFYSNRPLPVKFGVSYPGFDTFYAAGGWGAGPGYSLPYNGTGTFSQTLQLALNSGTAAVQLATWNDYGEGTMIEPTREFGYGFLTTLQQALGVGYSQTVLELVDTLFHQRKQYAGNAAKEAQLDQAATDLASCQVVAATSILNGTGSSGGSSSSSGSASSSGSSSGTSGGGSASSSGSSGGGTASVCDGAGTRVLTLDGAFIDDFEEPMILPGWSSFNDETPAPNLYRITQVMGGAAGTAHSGEYRGSGAISVAAGGFGVGTVFNDAIDPANGTYCVDISAFDGVSFWAKSATAGSTITVNFVLPSTNAISTDNLGRPNGGDCNPKTAQCYDHPRVPVTLTADWAHYTVQFSAATGGSATVGRIIQEIAWLSPDAAWDFSLDEIAFYKGTPPAGAVGSGSGGAATTLDAGASGGNADGWAPHSRSGSGCTAAGTGNDDRWGVVAVGVLLGYGARRRRAVR